MDSQLEQQCYSYRTLKSTVQDQDSRSAVEDGGSQNIVESAAQLCQSYQLQGEGTCEKLQIEQRVLLDNLVVGYLDPC